jgi:hypothetical protein
VADHHRLEEITSRTIEEKDANDEHFEESPADEVNSEDDHPVQPVGDSSGETDAAEKPDSILLSRAMFEA